MKINEIFYSLQGEGYFSGTPAVFIRFSGCNLKCTFCDTQHEDGRVMTEAEIIEQIKHYPTKHVIITGGEPSLQLTTEFVGLLHDNGYFVQVETNGTRTLPSNVDWITCSPKSAPVVYNVVNEIKLVYEPGGSPEAIRRALSIKADQYYLQPCDVGDKAKNAHIIAECIDYIKSNPRWRLSLQTHKILDIR